MLRGCFRGDKKYAHVAWTVHGYLQKRSKNTALEINFFTLHVPSIKTQLEFESALCG